MAGPRSLSRSTKVVALGTKSGRAKGKGKHRTKHGKKKAPLPSWDHDKSSSEGESADEARPTAVAASAGKKRPRVGAVGGDIPEVQAPDDQDAGVRKSSGGVSKTQRVSGGGDKDGSSGSDGDQGDGGEEENEGGEEDAPASAAGGMGDVMARILGQKLDKKVQVPVLAKRKTKAMKEMENASIKRAESRGKSAVRRANMTQQFVIPDHTTTDYERQLKKIATRGVVALFNAISKRQNQGGDADGNGGDSVAGTAKAAAVKSASRHAFLNMLKAGVKPTEGAGSATATAGAGARSGGMRGDGSARPGGGASGTDGGKEDLGRSWSVLKEDYMMGASSMKNWDQDSAESEEDALDGPNDMSDDDSD